MKLPYFVGGLSLSLYLVKRTSAWIWWFCCLVRSCRVSTRTISVIYVIMNLNINAYIYNILHNNMLGIIMQSKMHWHFHQAQTWITVRLMEARVPCAIDRSLAFGEKYLTHNVFWVWEVIFYLIPSPQYYTLVSSEFTHIWAHLEGFILW